jgi:hypothetical protein
LRTHSAINVEAIWLPGVPCGNDALVFPSQSRTSTPPALAAAAGAAFDPDSLAQRLGRSGEGADAPHAAAAITTDAIRHVRIIGGSSQ